MALEATAVSEAGNSGRKKAISDSKQFKLQWFKNDDLFSAKYEAGNECSSYSDFTAHLLCLNILV